MKKYFSLVILILMCTILFVGCRENEAAETRIDYSKYSFVNISWTRDTAFDTETILFAEDGSFHYFCGCGNPVNDSDLCEGYTYDDTTKTITLDCIETTAEMITKFKVVKCDENSLHLDFGGEIRIFEKQP